MTRAQAIAYQKREQEAFLDKFNKLTFNANEDEFRWFLHYEEGSVIFIKKHLLSNPQKQWLSYHNLDIADLLNGRFLIPLANMVDDILNDWNTKLGYKHFGF